MVITDFKCFFDCQALIFAPALESSLCDVILVLDNIT
jgi:hypothetical protein